MKPPIKETQSLLKASHDYLVDSSRANERAFFQALEALEAAEQQERVSRSPILFLMRRNVLALGA
ncbi:MAG TPA: hypothetical protein VMT24_15395, partial [Aggregatilineaceae bacterium]|nr:hypothetical protein [Aggregatilineaceae bacterium]